MKKILMECTLFYVETSPKTVNLLIVNDATSSYSLVEASNKVINELDPSVLSSKLMTALLTGLESNGYRKVENSYEL